MDQTLEPLSGPLQGQPRTTWFPGGQRLAFFLLLVAILAVAFYTIRPVIVVLLFAAAVASLAFGWFQHLAQSLGCAPHGLRWPRQTGANPGR